MSRFIPIKVECHSGYKADEYPKCFYWDERRFEISEIRDRWYHRDPEYGYAAADYFKVMTDRNGQFIIKHELEQDAWYLVSGGN